MNLDQKGCSSSSCFRDYLPPYQLLVALAISKVAPIRHLSDDLEMTELVTAVTATKAPMKDVPVMVIRLTFLGIFELFLGTTGGFQEDLGQQASRHWP